MLLGKPRGCLLLAETFLTCSIFLHVYLKQPCGGTVGAEDEGRAEILGGIIYLLHMD